MIGVQFRNTPAFDVSVFSSDWLATGGQQARPPLGDRHDERPAHAPAGSPGPTWPGVLRDPGPGAGQGVIGNVNSLPAASNLAEDGVFGSATTAAVKAVQQLFDITRDGIVGPQTWSVLVTGTAP